MPAGEPPPGTPLAPSVEKAYYRKCIQLKRRLNEVEAANDEARIRRMRLDRSIMKMRLERAFLLDELRKRMEDNVDDSDGSGGEGMQTPPPDRPYRDKRRRQQSGSQATAPPNSSFPQAGYTPSGGRGPPETHATGSTPMVPGPVGQMVQANARLEDGRYVYVDPAQHAPAQASAALSGEPPAVPRGLSQGAPAGHTNGTDDADERDERATDRSARVTGDPAGTRTEITEENGERRVDPEKTGRSASTAASE